ncbi:hypothetical protein P2W68_17075 [Chryseobacterium arthrosphaerae]|uniref:hypothetical protein n=1 Tax=Chryseobacterium arthrosphaerae TaxID=651561 RepID=UPI0023E23F31|nr:hypothetical protein [Chryseobacterium arthrosphaerae]WES96547.1 hypothetical protein P2W68_17075 [Chryseobacterium arthrosphaerae]
MKENFSEKLQKLNNRYNPDGDYLFESVKNLDATKLSSFSTPDEYVRKAMSAVDDKFTSDIILAGNNVKAHLSRNLEDVTFEFQGSVMTNTHIEANSDIDLLVITEKFCYITPRPELQNLLNSSTLNFAQRNVVQEILGGSPFFGSTENVLLENRLKTETTLSTVYDICDIAKSKCVRIFNKNLKKPVEAVIACYEDDVFSIKNLRNKSYRGLKIYEKNIGTGKTDHPFYTIDCINNRSSSTNGRLKKMIRFLKNFMYDSDYEYNELKSFGVNIICYNIPIYKYNSLHYVAMLFVIQEQLEKIINDIPYMASLTSIDGSEKLFYDNSGNFLIKKYNEVAQLNKELKELLSEIYFNFKNAI